MRDSSFRKMVFELEPNEHGYPPVRYEGIWVRELEGERGVYVVGNIPFYAYVAMDDHVRAVDVDGELKPIQIVRSSGHGTVRVIAEPAQLREVRKIAADCGCASELSEEMVAIDVPPEADWPRLQAELAKREAEDLLGYEEALLPAANRPVP